MTTGRELALALKRDSVVFILAFCGFDALGGQDALVTIAETNMRRKYARTFTCEQFLYNINQLDHKTYGSSNQDVRD